MSSIVFFNVTDGLCHVRNFSLQNREEILYKERNRLNKVSFLVKPCFI